ncbi:MAG: hypothetical protein UZ17_ACD001002444 [Acidobacteria bacterium OLB17]|nr:MAG: hypothetical protein UZ17_ACD001002444 [Acidobacteria bacterium OLB17]
MERQAEQEIWQVEANNEIYQGSFDDLSKWIEEGSLLRADKVRKGNLRWIEAGRVPSLAAVFNAVENGRPIPVPIPATEKADPTNFTLNSAVQPAAGGLPGLEAPGEIPEHSRGRCGSTRPGTTCLCDDAECLCADRILQRS